MLTTMKEIGKFFSKFEFPQFFENFWLRHPPGVCMILGTEPDVYFQRRWRLKFLPVWSYVNENEKKKKIENNQKFKI